jgi:BioD-like phosphotransacetylase family protein
MRCIVVASTRRAAGKTSTIVGIASNLDVDVGYVKPMGDRLLYRKKRLWDYDAALMTDLFDLRENPEDICIGLDHSKLRYAYDQGTVGERLREMVARVGEGRDLVFVEGCRGLTYGASVHLDPLSVVRTLDARLLLVASGEPDAVVDDLTFICRSLDLEGIEPMGVVINKVTDVDEFREVYLDTVTSMGLRVLGIVPHREELARYSVRFLADALFAKVQAGEAGMDRIVENVFVGAMSAQAALANPKFQRRGNVIITGGDRTDMILAALDGDTVAVVLTNNVHPSPHMVAKAETRGIPLLLVAHDTYKVARIVDDLEPLHAPGDDARVATLRELAREHIDLGALEK